MDEITEELLARAKAGDREAFNEIVRRTYQRVHALALRLTGNEQDADDVVQDTYVRAFRGLRRFRGDARFSTWLHRITTNTASTFRDRRRRHTHRGLDDVTELADGSVTADPEASAEQRAVGARLVSALNGLPSRLRSVVVLRDLHGMSHREIASALEITEAAAKVRLHRARAKLREVLSRDGLESADSRPEDLGPEPGSLTPPVQRRAVEPAERPAPVLVRVPETDPADPIESAPAPADIRDSDPIVHRSAS